MDVNAALVVWFGTAHRDGHDVNSLPYRLGQWAVEAATQRAEASRVEWPPRRQS